MEEIVYQVTRDSLDAQKKGIVMEVIALWPPDETVEYREFDGGYWEGRSGMDPLYEFTVEEFQDSFYMDAPEPEKKFFISTLCKWEKVT